DGGRAGLARAGDGEFHPVLHGGIFGLACAPDVASFDVVLHEDIALAVDDLHDTVGFDFEGFVVRAVLFRFFGHQPDVGHAPHGGGIKCTMFLAVADDFVVDASVAGIRNDGFGVLRFAFRVP